MQCRLFPDLKTVTQSKQFFQCNFQQNDTTCNTTFQQVDSEFQGGKNSFSKPKASTKSS